MIPPDTQKIDYSWILLVGSSDFANRVPWAGITFNSFQHCDVCRESNSHFRATRDVSFRTRGSPSGTPDLSESICYSTSSLHSLPEKIDANLPQRRHRPRRHLGPVASVRPAEVRAQKVRVPVLDDGRADFAHQRELVVHVVHRQSGANEQGKGSVSPSSSFLERTRKRE